MISIFAAGEVQTVVLREISEIVIEHVHQLTLTVQFQLQTLIQLGVSVDQLSTKGCGVVLHRVGFGFQLQHVGLIPSHQEQDEFQLGQTAWEVI